MFVTDLPCEVILLIVDHLSGTDLTSLHAVNKYIFGLTDQEYLRRLFRQSTIAISSRSLHRLSAIAASDRLRVQVRSLRILCIHAPPAPGPDEQNLINRLDPQKRQDILWWDTSKCRALYHEQYALLSAGKAVTSLVMALNRLPACHTIDLVRDRIYDFSDELILLQSLETGWRWRDQARGIYPPRPLLRQPGNQELIQQMVGTVMEAIRQSSQVIKNLRVDALLGFSHVLADPITPVMSGADEEEKENSGSHVQSHSHQWENATRNSASQSSISLPSLTDLHLCLSRARYSPGLRDLTLPESTLSEILGHFEALKYLCIDMSRSYRFSSLYPSFSRARLGPTVSHLKLCSVGVAADDLIGLLQQHPQLRHLCLYHVSCRPVSAPMILHAFLGAVRDLVNPEMQFLEIKACRLRTSNRGAPQEISLLWETDEKKKGQQERLAGASDCDCHNERERLCEKCLEGLQDSIVIRPSSLPWSSDSIKVFNETSESSQPQRETTSTSTSTTTTTDETQNRVTFAQAVNEALCRLRLEYEPLLRVDIGAARLIHTKPLPTHVLLEPMGGNVNRGIVSRWADRTSWNVLRPV